MGNRSRSETSKCLNIGLIRDRRLFFAGGGGGSFGTLEGTGSGAVVAHLLWGQAVGGSNPPSPTGYSRASCGRRSKAGPQISILTMPVRFRSPALIGRWGEGRLRNQLAKGTNVSSRMSTLRGKRGGFQPLSVGEVTEGVAIRAISHPPC